MKFEQRGIIRRRKSVENPKKARDNADIKNQIEGEMKKKR
jgi:hypothetical protein